MHCNNCGHELPDGVRFCSNCGAPVADQYPEHDYPEHDYLEHNYEEQGPDQPYAAPEEHIEPRPEPQQRAAGGQNQPSDTKAIVSLCCGVFAAICMFTGAGSIIGLIAAIVGLVFGIKARKENPSTMATVGIVLCALNVALCALVFIGCLACLGSGIAAGAGAEIIESLENIAP